MIKLKKLYFEPNNFSEKEIAPIIFNDGINFIIGEGYDGEDIEHKDENKKMNSVGKSISVEFINFCLLKELRHSRVNKIPFIDYPETVYACLDLEISSDKSITIKRGRDETMPIIFLENEVEKSFGTLQEAKDYLDFLFFPNSEESTPSFRSMMSIIIRDEKTQYDDFLKTFSSRTETTNFSELIKPHLYLFGFDLLLIDTMKKDFKKFDDLSKTVSAIKNDFKMQGIDYKKVRSYLNELGDIVSRLDLSISELKPAHGVEQTKRELNSFILELERLTTEKASREYMVQKINSLPKLKKINTNQVKIVYNQFKLGLGDLVKTSIDQVLVFKEQIDIFQNTLMKDKSEQLQSDIDTLDIQINRVNYEMSKIYKMTNAKEKIDSLTETVRLHRQKNEELNKVSDKYKILEAQELEKKQIKRRMVEVIDKMDAEIYKINSVINSFESQLKVVHEFITGNQRCHFQIKTVEDRKEYLDIDYRVNLDGGANANRIRTFIYDILLMLNDETSKRHPCFLIHDNIFASTGLDDRVKSLNYLYRQEAVKKFQYIVTINKDEFSTALSELEFDYEKKVVARFSRQNPFLLRRYNEI